MCEGRDKIVEEYYEELEKRKYYEELEKEHKKELVKIKEYVKELKKEMGEEGKKMRLRFLEKKLKEYEEELKRIYENYEQCLKEDLSYLNRALVTLRLPDIQRKIKQLMVEIKILKYGKDTKNHITREMIEEAMRYPIEDIVEVNRAGFARCIEHDDEHPSMWCKNNFAYCFVCCKSWSVIDLAMKKWGLTFPEAVRRLNEN